MDQIKVVKYLVYVIFSIIVMVGSLPLFDPVISIFIILLLFLLAMTLLYFRNLLMRKKIWDFDQ